MTSRNGGAAAAQAPSGQDLAGLGQRFTALLIDWVACLMFAYVLQWTGLVSPGPLAANLLPSGLFIVYYTLALGLGAQSLGMAIMRIACVSVAHGGSIGLGRALVRAVLLTLVLPALTALADPFHRGLHDRAAGSVMLSAAAPARS